jgi:hypothetical protein
LRREGVEVASEGEPAPGSREWQVLQEFNETWKQLERDAKEYKKVVKPEVRGQPAAEMYASDEDSDGLYEGSKARSEVRGAKVARDSMAAAGNSKNSPGGLYPPAFLHVTLVKRHKPHRAPFQKPQHPSLSEHQNLYSLANFPCPTPIRLWQPS